MEFSLSAEQLELKEAAAAFARGNLNHDLAKYEASGEFPLEAWQACARFGIQGLPVPAELGGGGSDILTTVLIMEALGYGCHDNGLIFSLNAQMWSIELPLVKFGTPAQQQAYLPGLVSGDLIGVHAMTEPDSGSDAFSMRTHAERVGDHYLLNGTKLYITNAPVADVVLVFASHPGRPRQPGEDGPAHLADGRSGAGRLQSPGRQAPGSGGGGDGHLQLINGLGTELHPCQRRGRDAAPA